MHKVYVFDDYENYGNPHTCIYPGEETEPCLTCLLIEELGQDRRDEALEIASNIALRLDSRKVAVEAGCKFTEAPAPPGNDDLGDTEWYYQMPSSERKKGPFYTEGSAWQAAAKEVLDSRPKEQ